MKGKRSKGFIEDRKEAGRGLFRMGAVMQWMGDVWLVSGKAVNLFKLTCECWDYNKYRHLTEVGYRCKHMFAAILAQEEMDAKTKESLAALRREKEAKRVGE